MSTIKDQLAELRKLEAQMTNDLTAFQAPGDKPHWRVNGKLPGLLLDKERYAAWFPASGGNDKQNEIDAKGFVALRNTALPLLKRQDEALKVAIGALEAVKFSPYYISVASNALASISAILSDTTQEGK